LTKWIAIWGGVLSGVSVLIGAFGAHNLNAILDVKAMGWVETGVNYQTTHALALIACGLLPSGRAANRTAILFVLGIVLFSGSLYTMALTGVTKLGIVTPVGGVLFMAGWVSFCWMVWTTDKKSET